MKTLSLPFALALLFAPVRTFAAAPADSASTLIGTWTGKATGPQGGPPTGDITVLFEKDTVGIKGKITVKGSGGGEYSGQVSNAVLKNKIFSAVAVFKLGENPLEIRVTGPLKGKTIDGTFEVLSKGKKMGDGTFAIIKTTAAKKSAKK